MRGPPSKCVPLHSKKQRSLKDILMTLPKVPPPEDHAADRRAAEYSKEAARKRRRHASDSTSDNNSGDESEKTPDITAGVVA